MKTFLRTIVVYILALYFIPQFDPGLTIDGGFTTLVIGAVVLALMFLIIKPILTIISFPINMITLGIFSIFINAIILYLLTIIVPDITIQPFTYHKLNLLGVVFPTMEFNTFFSYVYTAFVIACINTSAKWLTN